MDNKPVELHQVIKPEKGKETMALKPTTRPQGHESDQERRMSARKLFRHVYTHVQINNVIRFLSSKDSQMIINKLVCFMFTDCNLVTEINQHHLLPVGEKNLLPG